MTKKSDKHWFAEEIKNRSALTYGHNYTRVPGCESIEAIWNKIGYPIGTLWFTHCGAHTIDITSIYVIDHFRRLGVATYLVDKLHETFPSTKAIITGTGNKESIPWLKKLGFKFSKSYGWRKEV